MFTKFDHIDHITDQQWDDFLSRCEHLAVPEQDLRWIRFLELSPDLVDRQHCPSITALSVWCENRLEALYYVSEESNLHVTSADGMTYVNLPREIGMSLHGYHVRLSLAHGVGVICTVGDCGRQAETQGIEALEIGAREQGLHYVQISRVPEGSDLRAVLKQRGYIEFPNINNYALDIEWDTFDEYVLSRSGKIRAKIRRERKSFVDNGLRLDLLNPGVDYARLYELHHAVCEKYGGIPYVRDGFFESAMKVLSGFDAICAYHQDEPVGVSFFYRAGGALTAKFAGINYDWHRRGFVYSNLWYGIIQYAIETRQNRVYLGLGNEEQKHRLGARIELSYRYILAFTPQLREKLMDLNFTYEEVKCSSVRPD